jgi:hypothetical protein
MPRSPSVILYDPTKPRSEANDPIRAGQDALEVPRACEDSKDGHLVVVAIWPPKQRYSGTKRQPSVAGVCERCGANVVVYDPIQPGLRVKVPSGQVLTSSEIVAKAETKKA